MLIVYRIGAFIPVPNINTDVLKLQDQANQSDVFGLLNTFSGGALVQILHLRDGNYALHHSFDHCAAVVHGCNSTLCAMGKRRRSRKKENGQITRYGTIILGVDSSFWYWQLGLTVCIAGLVIDPGFTTYALIAIVLTAGTAFLMWLGEQITEYGIGNGISIIIFAGIVAAIPTSIQQIYKSLFATEGALFLNIVKTDHYCFGCYTDYCRGHIRTARCS